MALITLGANSGKGKVLQVVRTYVANSSSAIETSINTSFQSSGIQATLTPNKSGNLILVDFNSTMAFKNTSNWGASRMYQKIGSGSFAQMTGASSYHVVYSDHNHNGYAPVCFGGSYTTTNTDTLIFEPYIISSNTNSFKLVHQNASYALTLTEVEQ